VGGHRVDFSFPDIMMTAFTATNQRVQYGGCSFIPPHGFFVQKEASLIHSESFGCEHAHDPATISVCITLTDSPAHPEMAEFSQSAKDMNPDAYPETITLTTFKALPGVSALNYLRRTDEVLKHHFNGFQIDFYKIDAVGVFTAACSQCSFLTNFRIYRFNFAWIINEVLVTSTMTVTESGVEKRWVDLRSFVESVRF